MRSHSSASRLPERGNRLWAGSKKVAQLHGTLRLHSCLQCEKEFDYESIAAVVAKQEVPRCDLCGGLIKPRVTFFGEALPEEDLRNGFAWAAKADLMIVLGSSLTVEPAASIPRETLRAGGKLAIINNTPTHLDQYASFKGDDLATFFTELNECF